MAAHSGAEYRKLMISSMSGTPRQIQNQSSLFTPAAPPRAEMERAFFASDATYDGVFVTGVRTTGIFCRPSCRARKPLVENIEFFGSVREALAGRACPSAPALLGLLELLGAGGAGEVMALGKAATPGGPAAYASVRFGP